MIVDNTVWNINNSYIFKPVDGLSILNKKTETIKNPWNSTDGLVMPTTKLWPLYRLDDSGRTIDVPFFYFTAVLSGSFNKIIFPSVTPTSFLTQSVASYLYYLDVYESSKIPVETLSTEHLRNDHGLISDTSNLTFEDSSSTTGYSAIALIPDTKAFTIAWGCVTQSSGAISSSILPRTYDTSPSTAVYNTYKSILNISSSLYSLYTQSLDHFYAITLDKNKLSNGIQHGTVEIPFMVSASYISFTGSNLYTNDILRITDDSLNVKYDYSVGSYSYLVSGTIDNKNINDIYGHVYYDLGIFILDSNKLDDRLALKLNLSTYPDLPLVLRDATYESELNTVKLFNSIQACSYKNTNNSTDLHITTASNFSPSYIKCSVKDITIENPLFVTINPNEYCHSTNPSWVESDLLATQHITGSTIPVSCNSFIDAGYGCDDMSANQQKYVYWYYPDKNNTTSIYAAYFLKNELQNCSCEFLGLLSEYKRINRLPHTKYIRNKIKSIFVYNPVTYITSIGLYNEKYELLATGKLSTPLKNTNTTSYIIKINIKY